MPSFRPVLAALLALAILGAVGGYLRLQRQLLEAAASASPADREETIAAGKFALEITLTFDAGADSAFALEPTQETALRVRFRDRDLLHRTEPAAAGTLRIENVPGIVAGANEFYVEAHPSNPSLPVPHAVRVRVLRDEHPVAEQTLWSEPGLPVQGSVRIDVPLAAVSSEQPSH